MDKTMNKKILLFLLVISSVVSHAQVVQEAPTDSVMTEERDTVLIQSYAKRYKPGKSLLYAAVLPGLGQIYNKKYWKLPLVYGGFIATGYAVKTFNDQYTEYRDIVFKAVEAGLSDSDFEPDLGMQNTLGAYRIATDRARRQRDFFMIIMAGVYILQMVDAHVDTHLKEFDLNPRLHVRLEPLMEQDYLAGRNTGMSLILRF
jgi:Family of unknown function (DUF5683)